MIHPNYFWLNVVLLAIGTLLIRVSIIALSSRITLSQRTREIFSFIPASILPAFIAPAIFFHQGQVSYLMGKERLLVGILAVFISYWKKNTLLTIASGLITLYLLSHS